MREQIFETVEVVDELLCGHKFQSPERLYAGSREHERLGLGRGDAPLEEQFQPANAVNSCYMNRGFLYL